MRGFKIEWEISKKLGIRGDGPSSYQDVSSRFGLL